MTSDKIQSKLAILRDNLTKLDAIPQATYEEFASDFRNLDSALHRLQTSIQALIDIGSFVVASRGLAAPGSSHAILEGLESAGHLPAGSGERFGSIFGFRNRVVHLYDRIDPKIVFRILTEDRADLEELARLLLEAIEATAP